MVRKQNERDLVRRPCVKYLRQAIAYNQLKRFPYVYWSCAPDVGKQPPRVMARLVADGYEKGVFDMTIIAANEKEHRTWLIEFKYGKNSYTKEQKAIATLAENTPVQAIKIYSVDEFIELIERDLK